MQPLFLDKNLDLNVSDFTNSEIFSSLDDPLISKMEVFELGLALYEISTGIELFHGLFTEEKDEALRLNGFPDLSQTGGGRIISHCWNPEFHTMADLLQCIYKVWGQI